MSECVVRMEMPKSCRSCPLCHFVGSSPVCAIRIYPLDTVSRFFYADERPSKCPILCQLPEGHGRLVDVDANFLGVIHLNGGGFANYNTTIAERIGEEDMRMVKVIVPAERSET